MQEAYSQIRGQNLIIFVFFAKIQLKELFYLINFVYLKLF